MTLGVSLFLMVIGAILIWAVDLDLAGIDTTIVGWILLVAGIAAAVASIAIGRRPVTVVEEHRDHRRG